MPQHIAAFTAPRRFDDGARGAVAMIVPLPLAVVPVAVQLREGAEPDAVLVGSACFCLALAASFAVYAVWTHVLFTRTSPEAASRIAAAQYRGEPSMLARMLGFGSTESWAVSPPCARTP